MKLSKNYKYKNLTIVLVSIIVAVFLSRFSFSNQFISQTTYVPAIGSFIAGMLYAYSPTAALGILLLSDLSKTTSPIEISLLAGLGCTIGDYTIFRFLRNNLFGELKLIYHAFGGKYLTNILFHKSLRWSLRILGAVIIASPFPDELGISLMGISNMKTYQFIILCFALDTIGIFLFVSAFRLII